MRSAPSRASSRAFMADTMSFWIWSRRGIVLDYRVLRVAERESPRAENADIHWLHPLKTAVEGDHCQTRGLGERRQIGIRPKLCRRPRRVAQFLEPTLELWRFRFTMELDSLVVIPAAVCVPGGAVPHDVVFHHLTVGQ